MKRYLVLFAIFITAIFFYPVFAHAERLEQYLPSTAISAPFALLLIGSGLLVCAALTKRVIKD